MGSTFGMDAPSSPKSSTKIATSDGMPRTQKRCESVRNSTWYGQLVALTTKNVLVQYRMRRSFACEVLTPLVIVVMLGVLDVTVRFGKIDPHPKAFMSLQAGDGPLPCYVFGSEDSKYGYGYPIPQAWCVPLVFAPARSTQVVEVMERVKQQEGYDTVCIYDEGGAGPDNRSSADFGYPLAPSCCGTGGEHERTKGCILGFETYDHMREWMRLHGGRSAIAVAFGDMSLVEDAEGNEDPKQEIFEELPDILSYEVWYNQTNWLFKWYAAAGADRLGAWVDAIAESYSSTVTESSYFVQAQFQIDNALLWYRAKTSNNSAVSAAAAGSEMRLDFKPFPRLNDAADETVSRMYGSLFFQAALGCVPFVLMASRVTREKDRHITGIMRSTGLYDGPYWLSYWAQAMLTAALVTLLVYIAGVSFQLQIFERTNASVLIAAFFCFMLAQFALAFTIAALAGSLMISMIIAFLFTVLAMGICVWGSEPGTNAIAYFYWEPDLGGGSLATLIGVFLPSFNLIKIVNDATVITTMTSTLNTTTAQIEYTGGSHLTWDVFFSHTLNRTTSFITYNKANDPVEESTFESPPPGDAFSLFFASIAIYSLLAWYAAQVFTGGDARPQPFHFPFQPSYWVWRVVGGVQQLEKLAEAMKSRELEEGLDSDVAEEIKHVCAGGAADTEPGVLLLDLRKSFGSIRIGKDYRPHRQYFHAVRGMCLSMAKKQCFALLGHNGAGKTTTIKMVTGQIKPSAGDALIEGLSVSHESAKVRTIMGICPQHDVLYDELTSTEHLQLYGAIKGLSREVRRPVKEARASERRGSAAPTRPAPLPCSFAQRARGCHLTCGRPWPCAGARGAAPLPA